MGHAPTYKPYLPRYKPYSYTSPSPEIPNSSSKGRVDTDECTNRLDGNVIVSMSGPVIPRIRASASPGGGYESRSLESPSSQVSLPSQLSLPRTPPAPPAVHSPRSFLSRPVTAPELPRSGSRGEASPPSSGRPWRPWEEGRAVIPAAWEEGRNAIPASPEERRRTVKGGLDVGQERSKSVHLVCVADLPYCEMIRICLNAAPKRALMLDEIYAAMEERWPVQHDAGIGWRDCVRRALSQSGQFVSLDRVGGAVGEERGRYWIALGNPPQKIHPPPASWARPPRQRPEKSKQSGSHVGKASKAVKPHSHSHSHRPRLSVQTVPSETCLRPECRRHDCTAPSARSGPSAASKHLPRNGLPGISAFQSPVCLDMPVHPHAYWISNTLTYGQDTEGAVQYAREGEKESEGESSRGEWYHPHGASVSEVTGDQHSGLVDRADGVFPPARSGDEYSNVDPSRVYPRRVRVTLNRISSSLDL